MKRIVNSLVYLSFPMIFCLFICLFMASCGSRKQAEKPVEIPRDFNVILISIDTLRADHLGCYRYPRETSPAIDKFSKDAVLFRRCMAQCTSTLASHGSMLTSLIVSHHGAYFTRSQALPDEILTMAEYLKTKGYRTASFNDGGQIDAEFGLNQGFDLYHSMNPKNKNTELLFGKIVEKTTAWLDGHGKDHAGEKFFLFLHTYETHHPYTPEDKYLEMFEKDYAGKLPKHISVALIEQINKGELVIDEADQRHIINTYDAEIRAMDHSFGLLTAYLKSKGLYDNTMIIFTSDHGEEFGEHGIWAKHSHTLFNEQLHVPLIVKFPASRFAGADIPLLVRSIDIFPTVAAVLGEAQMPSQFEGISLLPMVTGDEKRDIIKVISQRDMQKTYPRKYWSVMTPDWKFYDSRLYDLRNDPGELKNVARDSEANRRLKSELESYGVSFMKRRKKRGKNKKANINKELKKKLETLGYVGN